MIDKGAFIIELQSFVIKPVKSRARNVVSSKAFRNWTFGAGLLIVQETSKVSNVTTICMSFSNILIHDNLELSKYTAEIGRSIIINCRLLS